MLSNRIVKFDFIATIDGQQIKSTIDIPKSHLKDMNDEQTKDFVRECVYTYIEKTMDVNIL